MDYLKKFTGGEEGSNSNQAQNQTNQQQVPTGEKKEGGGSFFDNIGAKMNSAAGGGVESEKNEDYLDKGIDLVQEKFMGAGKQDNESAAEQMKDEQISDYIRGQYKNRVGSDMPIKDKATRFG